MLQKIFSKLGVISERTQVYTLTPTTQPTANATETVQITLPCDQLLYGIDLRNTKDTDGTAVDNIREVRLILDGNKIVKKLTGTMIKMIDAMNRYPASTGFYKIFCTDPYLQTDPIPLHLCTTAIIEVDVSAAGSGVKNVIAPTLYLGQKQSYPKIGDFSLAKILVEKYLTTQAYGTATGQQRYNHERTYQVFGYVYETADGTTLSDSVFNDLTLQAFSPTEELVLFRNALFAQIKETNKQEANGATLPTGAFYVPFPDGLRSARFTNIVSLLNITTAGTNKNVKVCERYAIGGT